MLDSDRSARPVSTKQIERVEVGKLPLSRFDTVLSLEDVGVLRASTRRASAVFSGRHVWNVSSTARDGGVAEMLVSLLAYARGASIDARWAVIAGNERFFTLTKRVHNRLHGFEGDGGPLGEDERRDYEATLAPSADALRTMIRPRDVVILHDPQTAGLIEPIRALGVPVVWRCHVGVDAPNAVVRDARRFLEPYVSRADAVVFSRRAFAWDILVATRTVIISPSIDAYSPKNQTMDGLAVESILTAAGLRAGRAGPAAFTRMDGAPGVVHRPATTIQQHRLGAEDRYVLQVSRWDALKDPAGVIAGFAEHVAPFTDAHLVCAGPAVEGVSDDPQEAAVFESARRQWTELSEPLRARIHLALLPMDDPEENAAIVNALQRGADVVVQKSVAEGFGLTVAEAMWKSRPVVATRLGGIQDQIEHGDSGLLLDDDPRGPAGFRASRQRAARQPCRSRRHGLRRRPAGARPLPGTAVAAGLSRPAGRAPGSAGQRRPRWGRLERPSVFSSFPPPGTRTGEL